MDKILSQLFNLIDYLPGIMVLGVDGQPINRRIKGDLRDFVRAVVAAIIAVVIGLIIVFIGNGNMEKDLKKLQATATETNIAVQSLCDRFAEYKISSEARLTALETRQKDRIERELQRLSQ